MQTVWRAAMGLSLAHVASGGSGAVWRHGGGPGNSTRGHSGLQNNIFMHNNRDKLSSVAKEVAPSLTPPSSDAFSPEATHLRSLDLPAGRDGRCNGARHATGGLVGLVGVAGKALLLRWTQACGTGHTARKLRTSAR